MAEKTAFQAATQNENVPKHHSRIPLSSRRYETTQFGLVTPFYSAESVPGDTLRLNSKHNIRSASLKAPLMSDVFMQKDFFSVPMQALLPLNWQKLITNPVSGDDVVARDINCCAGMYDLNFGGRTAMSNPFRQLKNQKFFSGYAESATFETMGNSKYQVGGLATLINLLNFSSFIYSRGSLLSTLGTNLWPLCKGFRVNTTPLVGDQLVDFDSMVEYSFDEFYDHVFSNIKKYVLSNRLVNNIAISYILPPSNKDSNYTTKSAVFSSGGYYGDKDYSFIDAAIDFCREHFIQKFHIPSIGPKQVTVGEVVGIYQDSTGAGFEYEFIGTDVDSYADINLAPCAAYQMVCAHYFTNDRIDDIYSAELYRDSMRSLSDVGRNDFSGVYQFFTFNGVRTFYDSLSGKIIRRMFEVVDNINGSIIVSEGNALTYASKPDIAAWYYVLNLLGFNRSLRFQDYFTGSRLSPLGVGNTNVSVDASAVSVIDITRNIQMQRFLNTINRIPRKLEGYFGKLFGANTGPDYHNPSYLGQVRDKVITYETENTAEAQQKNPVSVTSTFSSNGDKYVFEFESGSYCILLGLVSFDIPRVYSRTIDRNNLHIDRFDYFNPFMQTIGDQPVYRLELNSANVLKGDNVSPAAFGYQTRHAEYKTTYPTACGGFIEKTALPNWQFIADAGQATLAIVQSSEFIRSKPYELDKFYISMYGYSPATRYHFICDFVNDVQADRPMILNPNIL